ncbi:hypothetical protein HPB48_006534 [Haemaphysalis longicornis]|uniref:Tetraspanin n=1 Tax=Haemaphysalis longicornis TaxID=44386 RepID=A0A9J6GAH2_HAELO|nr:hypothetical protein HPB48_006534 [Haemaphysalis longicornis]
MDTLPSHRGQLVHLYHRHGGRSNVPWPYVYLSDVVQAYSMYLRWDEMSLGRGSLLVSMVVNLEVPLLVVGAYLSFVASLGLIGALRENLCCLYCYDWMLFMLITATAGCFVLLIVLPHLATRDLQRIASIELIERYRDSADFQRLVDYIQVEYKCCGVTERAYLDWNNNMYFNCTISNPSVERCSVPPSCCRTPEHESVETVLKRRTCGYNVLAMRGEEAWQKVNTRNCVNSFAKRVQTQSFVLLVVSVVAICVLLLVKAMASWVLADIRSIIKEYDMHERKTEYRERMRRAFISSLTSPATAQAYSYVMVLRPPARKHWDAMCYHQYLVELSMPEQEPKPDTTTGATSTDGTGSRNEPEGGSSGPGAKRRAIENIKERKLSERIDNPEDKLDRMEKRLDNVEEYVRTTCTKSKDDRFTSMESTCQQYRI